MLTYSVPSGPGLAGPHRLGRDGREQPRRDHRLAQIVDQPAVVELAALEAGEHADMVGVEGEIALGGEAAEAGARPGLDRQGVGAERVSGSSSMSRRPISANG